MVFIPVAGSIRHSPKEFSTSVDMAMVPTSCFKQKWLRIKNKKLKKYHHATNNVR
jgi:hypothetical protein